MSLIIDPDNLNQGVEVIIDTTALTITLTVAGNLSNDGVTGQSLYSFLKEEWRTDATLIAKVRMGVSPFFCWREKTYCTGKLCRKAAQES